MSEDNSTNGRTIPPLLTEVKLDPSVGNFYGALASLIVERARRRVEARRRKEQGRAR